MTHFIVAFVQSLPTPGSGGIVIQHTPTWVTVVGGILAAWSVVSSFLPTPTPGSAYGIFFHIAQWIGLNWGRSVAVIKSPPPTTNQASGQTSGPGWR
jgi:hypothetical protein